MLEEYFFYIASHKVVLSFCLFSSIFSLCVCVYVRDESERSEKNNKIPFLLQANFMLFLQRLEFSCFNIFLA
jgi:hypothetical protein